MEAQFLRPAWHRQPGHKAADSEPRIRPTTECFRPASGRRADSRFRIRRFMARLANDSLGAVRSR